MSDFYLNFHNTFIYLWILDFQKWPILLELLVIKSSAFHFKGKKVILSINVELV